MMKKLTKLSCCVISALALVFGIAHTANADAKWPVPPSTNAKSVIAMDITTGTVLYEKNADETHYPASITKIMTGLLAVENCSLDEIVTFSADAVYKNEGDTSHISRDVGEKMTMEQCLYGMMLESANECAWAIGEHVAGGSMVDFADMMNKRAAELGCTNTHFNNPNGLPDEKHWTSARDMALISAEAYRNEAFRVIAGTKSYTIPKTNKHPNDETYLHNHHKMLYPHKGDSSHLYDYCVGGKTGYTTAANNTLVTYALKDDMPIVIVVMNAYTPDHYMDTRALCDYVFDNFKLINIASKEGYVSKVYGLSERAPFASIDENSAILVPNNVEFTDLEKVIEPSDDENVLGTLTYYYDDMLVGKADVIMAETKAVDYDFSEKEVDPNDAPIIPETTIEEEEEVKTNEPIKIQITPKTILIGLGVLAGLVLLGFLFYWLFSHAYIIRQKIALRRTRHNERKRYRTIQNGAYSSKGPKPTTNKKKQKLHF